MNKKRIVTVGLAVAVAFLVVSVPYTQNSEAISGAVAFGVGGIGLGLSFVLGVLVGHNILKSKSDSNNVEYDTWTKTRENFQSYFTKAHDNFAWLTNSWRNQINIFNESRLYYERVGEKRVTYAISNTTWNTTIEDYVCKPFDDAVANLTYILLTDYANLFGDILYEINGFIATTPTSDGMLSFDFYDPSDSTYHILSRLWVSSGSVDDRTYMEYIKIAFDGISTGYDLYINHSFGSDSYGDVYIVNSTDLQNNIKAIMNISANPIKTIWKGQGYANAISYSGYNFLPTSGANKMRMSDLGGYHYDVGTYDTLDTAFKNLQDVYNSIRNDIILNAHAYFDSLHNAGYYNTSDIPPDNIPIYPDIYMDGLTGMLNLTNESLNETSALWNAVLHQLMDQLNEQLGNNDSTPINWTDIDVGDIEGKKARLTLTHVTSQLDGSGDVYIANHTCYVIPYEHDLSLSASYVYSISLNTTKPTWADGVINQQIAIFDLQTGKSYYLIPNTNHAYNLTILECFMGNTSVTGLNIPVDSMGNLSYYKYGFGWKPSSANIVPPIIPGASDTSWLDSHLIAVAGLFVVGIVLRQQRRECKDVGEAYDSCWTRSGILLVHLSVCRVNFELH